MADVKYSAYRNECCGYKPPPDRTQQLKKSGNQMAEQQVSLAELQQCRLALAQANRDRDDALEQRDALQGALEQTRRALEIVTKAAEKMKVRHEALLRSQALDDLNMLGSTHVPRDTPPLIMDEE